MYFLDYPNELEVFGRNTGKTFYVGKGRKDRVLAHEKETRAILKSGRKMKLKHKHKVIIEIWDSSYDVVQQIVYQTDDEQEACEKE